MPYIPDLIPKDHQIIPEYFSKQSVNGLKPKAPVAVGPVLLGLLFLFIAIYNIHYTGFALLFGLLALSCTGAGKRWLERTGRFTLTSVARLAICVTVLVVAVPVYIGYAHQDEVDAAAREVAHQKALQFTADSLKTDSGRKVQLYDLLGRAAKAVPDSGLRMIVQTNDLVKTEAEKDSSLVVEQQLRLQLVQLGLAARNYKGTLAQMQKLLEANPRNPELWFYRARCYIGLDSMQLAVNALDTASARGYKPANKLFEQINPLKKHIVGYCTLCNDGSTSNATGRGACSWHGGVAEWNHPIYETSRKYGDK